MPLGQVQVPFPDTSMPGIRTPESGGRVINGYVEPLGANAPAPTIWRRAPGLRNFGTTTRTGFRGGAIFEGTLYCALGNNLVTFTAAGGEATPVGTPNGFTGTSKGFFARNNKAPIADKVFCDPDGNYAHFDNATFTMNYDTDLTGPNSVCSIDGFFIFTIADGRVFASDLNSTNVSALSFASAESKPDGLTRGVPWAGNLFLFGPSTTEVWSNVGTTPFAFQRSVVIPRGIAGPYCVAGFEDNFSRALVWVADDNTVVRLNGYTPEKISPPDLDGLIEDVTDKTKLEMSVYMARGHAFIILSASKAVPASPWREWSWVFDLNNNRWAERQSYLHDRSRITGGFYAFNKWLCGDLLSGNVQEITDQVHTESPGSVNVTDVIPGVQEVTAAVVAAGGSGYAVGNIINLGNDVHVVVQTISGSAVATVVISTPGGITSLVPPPNPVAQVSIAGGAGTGATFNLTWSGATGSIIRLVVPNSHIFISNRVIVSNIVGTVEANGTWNITIIDNTHIDLIGSQFNTPYTSGGVVTDTISAPFRWRLESGAVENFPVGGRVGRFDCEFVTGVGNASGADPIETDPTVEISWSDDGGQTYYAPILRKLGRQSQTRQLVSLISCTGRSGWTARRWRLDISDPVHVGFMAAYQNVSPKVSDIG